MVLGPFPRGAKVEALASRDEQVTGALAREQRGEGERGIGPAVVERARERVPRCGAAECRVEGRPALEKASLCEARQADAAAGPELGRARCVAADRHAVDAVDCEQRRSKLATAIGPWALAP